MMAGLGAFRNSGGYFAPMRDQYDERMDMYKQGVEQNLQANPYAAMIAAQEQDRTRNAEMSKRDNWLALAQAGLGMAAGNSSDFLTNVAAGGQQGLAALRQGMTEAEKRQAALQQRGDLLQAAGSTIEGNNAAAMRALAAAGFTSGTAMDRDIYTQAGGALREELTREANIAEAARERVFRGNESAAERTTRIRIAQLNEDGANSRAGTEAALLRQGIDDARVSSFLGQRDNTISDINAKYKLSDPATLASADYPRILAAARKEFVTRTLAVAKGMGVNADIVKDNPFGTGFTGGNSPAGKNRGAPTQTRNDGVIRD
jgi:hypothetical protein